MYVTVSKESDSSSNVYLFINSKRSFYHVKFNLKNKTFFSSNTSCILHHKCHLLARILYRLIENYKQYAAGVLYVDICVAKYVKNYFLLCFSLTTLLYFMLCHTHRCFFFLLFVQYYTEASFNNLKNFKEA